MKKHLRLFLAVPLFALMAACGSDDGTGLEGSGFYAVRVTNTGAVSAVYAAGISYVYGMDMEGETHGGTLASGANRVEAHSEAGATGAWHFYTVHEGSIRVDLLRASSAANLESGTVVATDQGEAGATLELLHGSVPSF